jgi:hypothetical protein
LESTQQQPLLFMSKGILLTGFFHKEKYFSIKYDGEILRLLWYRTPPKALMLKAIGVCDLLKRTEKTISLSWKLSSSSCVQ